MRDIHFPTQAAAEFHDKDTSERISWACGTVLIGIGAGDFRGAIQRVIDTAMGAAYTKGQRDASKSSAKV